MLFMKFLLLKEHQLIEIQVLHHQKPCILSWNDLQMENVLILYHSLTKPTKKFGVSIAFFQSKNFHCISTFLYAELSMSEFQNRTHGHCIVLKIAPSQNSN